jgi:hypothetical protein
MGILACLLNDELKSVLEWKWELLNCSISIEIVVELLKLLELLKPLELLELLELELLNFLEFSVVQLQAASLVLLELRE